MPGVIGVISDTHGLLRPEALDVLAGVELIVHAGDVGTAEVLSGLSRIAPVHAVRGNVDRGEWAQGLPLSRVVEVGEALVYVLHDLAELNLDPVAAGFAAVISGHSHKPRNEVRGGVLYLNPGSAGPRRFRLPVTVARITAAGAALSAEVIRLD